VIAANQDGQHCRLPSPTPTERATVDYELVGGWFYGQIERGDLHYKIVAKSSKLGGVGLFADQGKP